MKFRLKISRSGEGAGPGKQGWTKVGLCVNVLNNLHEGYYDKNEGAWISQTKQANTVINGQCYHDTYEQSLPLTVPMINSHLSLLETFEFSFDCSQQRNLDKHFLVCIQAHEEAAMPIMRIASTHTGIWHILPCARYHILCWTNCVWWIHSELNTCMFVLRLLSCKNIIFTHFHQEEMFKIW